MRFCVIVSIAALNTGFRLCYMGHNGNMAVQWYSELAVPLECPQEECAQPEQICRLQYKIDPPFQLKIDPS